MRSLETPCHLHLLWAKDPKFFSFLGIPMTSNCCSGFLHYAICLLLTFLVLFSYGEVGHASLSNSRCLSPPEGQWRLWGIGHLPPPCCYEVPFLFLAGVIREKAKWTVSTFLVSGNKAKKITGDREEHYILMEKVQSTKKTQRS